MPRFSEKNLSLLFVCINTSLYPFFTTATAHDTRLHIPGGPYKLATNTSIELVDYSRTNDLVNLTTPRALMLSIYYPVLPEYCSSSAHLLYMTEGVTAFEDNSLSGQSKGLIPTINYTSLTSHFYSDCTDPYNALANFPVVLFSPGWGETRFFYSALAQSVAMEGYIVIQIDHPYDADIVEFSSGQPTAYSPFDPSGCGDICLLALEARVQDVSFVLDQLSLPSVVKNLLPNLGFDFELNTSKAGMYGHSIGGATAAAAMVNDSRIAGGFNFDGEIFGPVISEGFSRPFLNFGSTGHNRYNTSYDASWNLTWPNLKGWKLELNLEGSQHNTFTDVPFLFDFVGVDKDALGLDVFFGTIGGRKAFEIMRECVGAFFDFVLKGVESEVLEKPSRRFPEVSFIL